MFLSLIKNSRLLSLVGIIKLIMTGIKCENINISTSIVKPFILCYVLSRTTIVYKTFLEKLKNWAK